MKSIFRFPFNWKTPFGYLVAYILNCCATFCVIYGHYMVFCFLIGSSWLTITCVKDITNDLNNLTVKRLTHESQQQLKRSLINIIQFHSDAKQLIYIGLNTVTVIEEFLFYSRLVDDFNGIYEYITTTYFLWTLLAIASMLLTLQMQLVRRF